MTRNKLQRGFKVPRGPGAEALRQMIAHEISLANMQADMSAPDSWQAQDAKEWRRIGRAAGLTDAQLAKRHG